MDFEQFGEYASSHICEYTDFYREFDFEQYGSGKEKTLEALFSNKKTFEKPLLLLCFDEELFSDEVMIETRLETTLDENVNKTFQENNIKVNEFETFLISHH